MNRQNWRPHLYEEEMKEIGKGASGMIMTSIAQTGEKLKRHFK